MAATIAQVAANAGVSASTVSRVFYRPNLISAATRERVQRAADELGWRPNPMARALITGKTSNIGLIVPDVANPFFPPIIKAVQQLAYHKGNCVFLAHSEEDPAQERVAVEALTKQVDGLILVSSRLPAQAIVDVAGRHRVVLINRQVPGVPAVQIDSATGMYAAIDHLAGLGHLRLAYLPGPTASWANQQRRKAIRAGAKAHGLTLTILDPIVPSFAHGLESVEQLLATEATAVIAYDDIAAMGVMTGLADRNISVPEDISVVGCDDVVPVRSRPALTTISARCEEAGRAAVELLLDPNGDSPVVLTGEFIQRGSTGPAPVS